MKKTNPTAFPGLERPDDDRRFPWWTVFAAAFAVRAVLNAAFFLRNGWQASHLIEIWYYYGVAGGSERLSPFDPTFWLLRFPGLFFGGAPLYAAVVLTGVLLSSLTALLVAVWVGRCAGRESGWWAGLVFAFLPAPLTLCLANFSHDLAGLPLTLVFLGAVAAWERGGSRLFWGATAVLALGAGLMVGPLAAGGLLAALLYVPARALGRSSRRRFGPFLYFAGLVLLLAGLGLLFQARLLEWLAPLAARVRGIDLAAQVRIGVGDLQPFPPNGLWNRYGLFLFLVPWGLYRSAARREFFPAVVALTAAAVAFAVNRGARLLDPALAALAGVALAGIGLGPGLAAAAAGLGFVALNLLAPSAASFLGLEMPFAAVFFAGGPSLASLWATRIQAAAAPVWVWFFFLPRRAWRYAWFLVPAALSAFWCWSTAGTSSSQVEYELYRSLAPLTRPGEVIFAPWNQGFFIRAVTSLRPLTTPERIDVDVNRVYWLDEDSAWRRLRERGVDLLEINTRCFAVTAVDPLHDRFAIRGNTVIGPQPAHIRKLSDLKKTLLYRLNYEPASLTSFYPIAERFDPGEGVGARVFRVRPAGEGAVFP